MALALLVWAAGVLAVLVAGTGTGAGRFDPTGLTRPFGGFGDVLAAPAARWDSVWYLAIERHGYAAGGSRAFFPLYPLIVRAGAALVGSPLVAGALVSGAAFLAALVLLHRLCALELGRARRNAAVAITGALPHGLLLPAVYSEALFLALSLGRSSPHGSVAGHGRASPAALAAARAARECSPAPARGALPPGAGGPPAPRRRVAGARARGLARLPRLPGDRRRATRSPRCASRSSGSATSPGPSWASWDGAVAAWDGARQLLSGSRSPMYFTPGGGRPVRGGRPQPHALRLPCLRAVATVGALRRLPRAYGLYCVAALALPLSWPVAPEPLMSLPRFAAVLFPCQMWLAAWAVRRDRLPAGAGRVRRRCSRSSPRSSPAGCGSRERRCRAVLLDGMGRSCACARPPPRCGGSCASGSGVEVSEADAKRAILDGINCFATIIRLNG